MPNYYGRAGARNLNAKLTAQSAAVIRHLWLTQRWTLKRLSLEFGLSTTSVHKLVRGQTWTQLDAAAEMYKLNRLIKILGGDVENEGVAESERSHAPYVVESEKTITTRVQKGKILPPRISKEEKTITLRDVMGEIGLEDIGLLTQELLSTLKGQVQKQQLLVDAWEQHEAGASHPAES